MASKISVIIDVAVDKANRGITSFRKSISEADGAVGKFKAGTKSASDSIKANIMPVAAAAGVAVAAFAVKSVKSASDLQESTNAVNVSFGKAADGVLEIGENAAESFGLSSAAFNQAAVAFSAFASEIAGPGGDVADVIEDLTRRSSDFASVQNIDVAEAMTVFRSGLSGETEPLKRFGINLSAARVEAFALATGLAETKGEITEAIKVQARYGLLMQETDKVAGDFANTSDGLANSTRIAAARMEDFQARVGEELIPVVETSVGLVLDLADAMEKLDISAGGAGESLNENRGVLGNITNSLQNQINPVRGLTQAYGAYKDAWDDAFGDGAADDVKNITSVIAGSVDPVEQYTKAALDRADAEAEAADADDEAAAALTRKNEKLRESIAAQEAATEATLEAIDSSLGYRNQTARTTEAIAKANEVIGDSESSAEDTAQAYRDMEGAALDQAAAAVRLAEDQAAANGETLSAEDKTRIYRRELESLAGYLNGDAAFAIAMHIQRLRDIPTSVNTQLRVSSGGRTPLAGRTGVVAMHDGGIVGGQSFAGLRPDEVPKVLQKGEAVLTPEQQGAMLSAGGGSGGPVNITINTGADPNAVIEAIRKYTRRNGPGWVPS